MTESTLETDSAKALHAQVSAARWERMEREARARALVFEAVTACHDKTELSWRSARQFVAPLTPWPTFVRYKRRAQSGEGPLWERLLDKRVPPNHSFSEEIRAATCELRRLDPNVGVRDARKTLIRRFGEDGDVSDTWLRRAWACEGLNRPGGAHFRPDDNEEVTYFNGGGGLALLAAAEAETGTTMRLALATLEASAARVDAQPEDKDFVTDDDDRDEHGQFTAAYNARRREGLAPGDTDDRWSVDEKKAARRDLKALRVPGTSEAVMSAKLLAMGITPLLTERRGFAGLDGPAGEWLGVLGAYPYMPATLDKTLAELGLLAVDDVLWQAHAKSWHHISRQWQGDDERWLRSVVYIDGTADPDWTRSFAKSGKVSRLGRVMPCLSRVAIHSGAGVPLLVETHAGTAMLRKRILPMLEALDRAIGPEADIQRLTIVDSEAGFAWFLWAMHSQTKMLFVTVLKGAVAKGAQVDSEGPWQVYRERDQLREIEVVLHGAKAPKDGIRIRVVEMVRESGRHRHVTYFATNAMQEDMPTAEVADQYLRRWPCQESQFRRGRDGGGLNRSHGYGAAFVEHVALQNKLEKAETAVVRAQKTFDSAVTNQEKMVEGLAAATPQARRRALSLGKRDVAAKQRTLQTRTATRDKLSTYPELIRVRDTTRDGIMTCLKLNMLSLIEFTLQEYFGSLNMNWRMFIEQFVALPVTVRSTETQCVYQIHANRRQPKRMAQLQKAVDEATRRRIVRGKQTLVFELSGFKRPGGSTP